MKFQNSDMKFQSSDMKYQKKINLKKCDCNHSFFSSEKCKNSVIFAPFDFSKISAIIFCSVPGTESQYFRHLLFSCVTQDVPFRFPTLVAIFFYKCVFSFFYGFYVLMKIYICAPISSKYMKICRNVQQKRKSTIFFGGGEICHKVFYLLIILRQIFENFSFYQFQGENVFFLPEYKQFQ